MMRPLHGRSIGTRTFEAEKKIYVRG